MLLFFTPFVDQKKLLLNPSIQVQIMQFKCTTNALRWPVLFFTSILFSSLLSADAHAAIADFEVVMKNGAAVTDRYTTTRQERNISLFVTQNRYPIRVQARTCRGQTLGPWITVRSYQLRHQPRIRRFWIVVARNVPDRTCFRLHFVSQTRTRPFIVSGRIRY